MVGMTPGWDSFRLKVCWPMSINANDDGKRERSDNVLPNFGVKFWIPTYSSDLDPLGYRTGTMRVLLR